MILKYTWSYETLDFRDTYLDNEKGFDAWQSIESTTETILKEITFSPRAQL